MKPIELASAVRNMLEAAGVTPTPELAYTYLEEHEQIETETILVFPSNPEQVRTSRRGDFTSSISVDIAVIRRVKPGDSSSIASLIDLELAITELLKEEKPIDDDGDPIAAAVFRVSGDPLYSQEKLRKGVFLGITRAEFEL